MRLTVLSILAVLSGLGVADPATHILDMLTDLTTLCEDLIVPASQLSVLNAPLLLFGAGPWPAVITGFIDIVTTLTEGIDVLDSLAATGAAGPPTAQFTDDDTLAVADAFQSYSAAQVDVLDVISRLGGILNLFRVTVPELMSLAEAIDVSLEAFTKKLVELVGENEVLDLLQDAGTVRQAVAALLEPLS